MLTPIEIQGKILKPGMGYSKKETDQFLEEILESYEELYKENLEIKDQINTLSDGVQYYKNLENTIQKTLILAEKTALETKETAKLHARAIEKEARANALCIITEAKKELDRVHNQTLSMMQQYDKYKAQFTQLVNTQIELLQSDGFQLQLANIDTMLATTTEDMHTLEQEAILKVAEDQINQSSLTHHTGTAMSDTSDADDVFEFLTDVE